MVQPLEFLIDTKNDSGTPKCIRFTQTTIGAKAVDAGSLQIIIQIALVHLRAYQVVTFTHIERYSIPISKRVSDGFEEANDPRMSPSTPQGELEAIQGTP
jgi:hypothetical protein